MTAELDHMPCVGSHRGVGIHAFQPRERIEAVVKPAIDAVSRISNPDALMAYVADRTNPPEARLFAAARVEALWQLAADDRTLRPKISLPLLHAYTAGLDSLNWASRWHYGTMLEPGPMPDAPARERRDQACAAELRDAQAVHRGRANRSRLFEAATN